MDRLRQLIHEIHRRSLWQVLLIYVGASWAVLQVVDTVAGALQLPDWVEPVALVLLIVGLPIVLATAFVQEGGPGHDRAVSEAEEPEAPATARGLLTWRNAFGGGVLAFALWGVVAAGWVMFGGATRDATSDGSGIEPSIAVMPCDDLSPTQDQAALAQGLAEEVSLALSGLDGMEKVIARHSTVALKSQGADLQTISTTLDVANVLNCTVARDRDEVRVTAQLTDVSTGSVLWSGRFDEPFTSVFAVYDVIARGVTEGLQVVLGDAQDETLVAEATVDSAAHESYLRGRYFWSQRTGEGIRAAIEDFERAVTLDPQYAEAWSGLADSYLLLPEYAGLELGDYRTWVRRGLDAAERAVSLGEDLALAHASLGLAHFYTGDWSEAIHELERAIELNPGYPPAHQWYGLVLYNTGRAQAAVAASERALRLDPVSQVITANLARALHIAGRTAEGIEQYREATVLDPGWPTGWFDLGRVLAEDGQYASGREAWSNAAGWVVSDADLWMQAYDAVVHYQQTGERAAIPRLEGDAFPLLWVYAKSGHTDEAIELIERFAANGLYVWVAASHQMYATNAIRADPRYQALLDEAGITW